MLGFGELISQLKDDAVALVHAEIALFKSKALDFVRRSRTAIILFVLAAFIAFVSLIGLVLGLVLALVPIVGAVLSGVIVLAGGLILAGVLGWFGSRLLSGPASHARVESGT